MLPFEFIVFGSPISLQTNNRALLQAWKAKVRQTAIANLPINTIPTRDLIQVEVVYYYKRMPLDIDNIAKPILDAFNLLIYIDDRQITDLIIRKRLIEPSVDTRELPLAIASALNQNRPFIFVKIEFSAV
ncbi:RusA family crossover junction endodeoxyribonuclease [Spirulina sp. 06S082]|uniref:RusA family crossover junction endodeoxyribonuclease n=1 Tax=Spirulina sp. 06S082 TaxID=3110248 RepID=UPI002B1FCDB1|nr:RusA family crossover junction endodeoxyribonuclease [Spirulina sp. 06S082]MEA5468058.1 RusA family crossover junction endodeoxyribonuclease [Spirulina sp. 06S082]